MFERGGRMLGEFVGRVLDGSEHELVHVKLEPVYFEQRVAKEQQFVCFHLAALRRRAWPCQLSGAVMSSMSISYEQRSAIIRDIELGPEVPAEHLLEGASGLIFIGPCVAQQRNAHGRAVENLL